MWDDDCVYQAPKEETPRAEHWLYNNIPDNFRDLYGEAIRLQRTIAALISVGAITEARAYAAYELAVVPTDGS